MILSPNTTQPPGGPLPHCSKPDIYESVCGPTPASSAAMTHRQNVSSPDRYYVSDIQERNAIPLVHLKHVVSSCDNAPTLKTVSSSDNDTLSKYSVASETLVPSQRHQFNSSGRHLQTAQSVEHSSLIISRATDLENLRRSASICIAPFDTQVQLTSSQPIQVQESKRSSSVIVSTPIYTDPVVQVINTRQSTSAYGYATSEQYRLNCSATDFGSCTSNTDTARQWMSCSTSREIQDLVSCSGQNCNYQLPAQSHQHKQECEYSQQVQAGKLQKRQCLGPPQRYMLSLQQSISPQYIPNPSHDYSCRTPVNFRDYSNMCQFRYPMIAKSSPILEDSQPYKPTYDVGHHPLASNSVPSFSVFLPSGAIATEVELLRSCLLRLESENRCLVDQLKSQCLWLTLSENQLK